ncbi:MAG TPA: 3-deoxy-D-manno-octulosonic acid transferase, partial [Pyrinomonadaceae bacterium]|nr:3-deoxy-D-manno-octulosonic acid transferase [Pyrinomonadaceae bacterium]
MYLAYSLLLTVGLLILIPRFLFHAIVHGKYIAGFRERLGSIPPIPGQKRVIWLHCVSVGETQAARPLVERLRQEFPQFSLVVSTITLTGQKLAREVFADQVERVFYFPFDWRWTARKSIAAINPSLVLIMETELWPNFLRECQRQRLPVALVNGRISRQSFRRYQLIGFFFSRVLASLNLAVMQSETDAARIADLGLAANKIVTAGNMKFDSKPIAASVETTRQLRERFALDNSAPLILAASTHAPEEKIILDCIRNLRSTIDSKPRLMLAPRHPERFREVATLLQNSGLAWARRTDLPAETDQSAEVILLDTIGELPATYALATIVFVGGSLIDRGGHNVLEPAATGVCVVTGAYTHNFEAIVKSLLEANAIIQLPPLEIPAITSELTKVLADLLANPEVRNDLGNRARQTVELNQ